jgi:hypothetical protein
MRKAQAAKEERDNEVVSHHLPARQSILFLDKQKNNPLY